ncbi:MAG: hypothetical protein HYY54_08470 [candidate division NC10 bacterium]|nr:hypothetical protein [candidate division NC10 bacterium]
MRRPAAAGTALAAVLLLASPAGAAEAPAPEAPEAAVRALERILSLWHDGSFDALYETGTATTRGLLSAGEFRLRMSAEACRPACCFAAFRLAQAAALAPERVLVRGTVGFEVRGPARPRRRCAPEERAYVLEWQEGRWRIPLTDVLSTF